MNMVELDFTLTYIYLCYTLMAPATAYI